MIKSFGRQAEVDGTVAAGPGHSSPPLVASTQESRNADGTTATRFMRPLLWTAAGVGQTLEACRAAPDTARASRRFAARSQAAPGLGIGTLTLHAFSSDNWQRPSCEVRELMSIFEEFLRVSVAEWVDAGIRTSVIGTAGSTRALAGRRY